MYICFRLSSTCSIRLVWSRKICSWSKISHSANQREVDVNFLALNSRKWKWENLAVSRISSVLKSLLSSKIPEVHLPSGRSVRRLGRVRAWVSWIRRCRNCVCETVYVFCKGTIDPSSVNKCWVRFCKKKWSLFTSKTTKTFSLNLNLSFERFDAS